MKKISIAIVILALMLLLFTFMPTDNDTDSIIDGYNDTIHFSVEKAPLQAEEEVKKLQEAVKSKGKIQFVFPLKVPDDKTTYITSIFGELRGSKKHLGQDIAAGGNPTNIEVVSAGKGVVKKNSFQSGGAGNYVVIVDEQSNLLIYYMHMRERSSLKVGEEVKAGQKIGIMGTTGDSSGIHLHFEIRVQGVVGAYEIPADAPLLGRLAPFEPKYFTYDKKSIPAKGVRYISNPSKQYPIETF